MRASARMDLLEKVGLELQKRYTFTEIDAFFGAMGFRFDPGDTSVGSKRLYAKEMLRHVTERDLIRVAQELDIVAPAASAALFEPPQNWKDTEQFRLFISHLSKDKQIATRLKEALAVYGILGFVAHEDIEPTLAWQDEIERALYTMDAFIAVHTPGFSASMWTQQEVGFALGRGTKIISFKMGEDPTGFIGKHQALPRRKRTAEDIAKEIDALLIKDERTKSRLLTARQHIPDKYF